MGVLLVGSYKYSPQIKSGLQHNTGIKMLGDEIYYYPNKRQRFKLIMGTHLLGPILKMQSRTGLDLPSRLFFHEERKGGGTV